MKIVNYEVMFIEDVKATLEKGWQPFGSPYVLRDNYYDRVYQAVVKYEEEQKEVKYTDNLGIERTLPVFETPEQKFKETAWKFYNQMYRQDDGNFYKGGIKITDDDVDQLIDQEWLDHLDATNQAGESKEGA